jgi:hypothetical protein
MNLAHPAVIALLFCAFSSQVKASAEQDFWGWFAQNEEGLSDSKSPDDVILERVADQIKKVYSSLTFEISPVKDGKQKFVISADGIKEGFPYVEKLFASAPKSDHWIFIKFRQRRPLTGILFRKVKVEPKDLFFTLESDQGKAGITIYTRGHDSDDPEAITGIAFLMIDFALREYDSVTNVGFVETKSYSEPSGLKKRPITELAQTFDHFIASQKRD